MDAFIDKDGIKKVMEREMHNEIEIEKMEIKDERIHIVFHLEKEKC